jgi:hypothetical protein
MWITEQSAIAGVSETVVDCWNRAFFSSTVQASSIANSAVTTTLTSFGIVVVS